MTQADDPIDLGEELCDESDMSDDRDFKPPLPYVKGTAFTALRHVPPEPFGSGYDTDFPPAQEDWDKLSQTQYCATRDPLPGQVQPHHTMELTITSLIRAGEDVPAQVVVVNGTLVAKIYDPLYYDEFNEFGHRRDTVIEADGDYSREAAAYTKLSQFTKAAHIVPTYHGSWTINVDTSYYQSGEAMTHMREVRLILIDRTLGTSMGDIKPRCMSSKARSVILKRALEAEAMLAEAGVNHQDFCPRNIMVTGNDYRKLRIDAESDIAVKIIDFNFSAVVDHPQYEDRDLMEHVDEIKTMWFPRKLSPIVRFFGYMGESSSRGWCSHKDRMAEVWLWKQFRLDPQYIPVIWNPKCPRKHPKYPDLLATEDLNLDMSRCCDGAGVAMEQVLRWSSYERGHLGALARCRIV